MEKQNLYIFNFKLFVIKILILTIAIGSIISYAIEELIIYKTVTNGAYKVNRILYENHKNEIPIFGSSRAGANIIPSFISTNCFNYGISGGNANVWLFFLEQELKKNRNTPILINYDLGGLRYGDGDVGNYIPNWDATSHIITSDKKIYYNIPFFKYFGHYESYLKKYLNEQLHVTKVIENGGLFELNTLTKERFQNLIIKRNNTPHIFINEKKLLAKLNILITSSKRKIIFIVPPYHESFFSDSSSMEEDNALLSYIQSKNNIEVIDLRNSIKNNDHFIDTSHLNYNGAKIFTVILREILQKKGLLRHGDIK